RTGATANTERAHKRGSAFFAPGGAREFSPWRSHGFAGDFARSAPGGAQENSCAPTTHALRYIALSGHGSVGATLPRVARHGRAISLSPGRGAWANLCSPCGAHGNGPATATASRTLRTLFSRANPHPALRATFSQREKG